MSQPKEAGAEPAGPGIATSSMTVGPFFNFGLTTNRALASRARGSQPISVGWRVPQISTSSPSGPPRSVCSSWSARWTMQSPGRSS